MARIKRKELDDLPLFCLLAFILVAPVFFSCTGSNNRSREKGQEKPSIKTASDKPVAGGDTDEHGCKTSAGYLWSVIKSTCIRLFEDRTRLNPLETVADKTTAAYVVFSDDNNRAELFLPSGKSLPSFLNAKRKVSPG